MVIAIISLCFSITALAISGYTYYKLRKPVEEQVIEEMKNSRQKLIEEWSPF